MLKQLRMARLYAGCLKNIQLYSRKHLRSLIGWTLIGVGLIGVVLPVIPGTFLLVIGCALIGKRHPLVEKLAEPMFRLGDALPEEKIPRALRPLWIQWRRLDWRLHDGEARAQDYQKRIA